MSDDLDERALAFSPAVTPREASLMAAFARTLLAEREEKRLAAVRTGKSLMMDRQGLEKECDRLRSGLAHAREALKEIAQLEGQTLIRPSMGPDYDMAYQNGALAAFNQAAFIANAALTPHDEPGGKA